MLLVGVSSRILVGLVSYLAVVSFSPVEPYPWQAFPEWPVLDSLARWDAGWYASIWDNGYHLNPGHQSNVAFFPAFPILIKLLTLAAPVHPFVMAYIVNMLLCWTAMLVLHRLCLLEFSDSKIADRAVLYLALFPTAFFFYAPYSESLFLFLSVSAFYFARRDAWFKAGVLAGLASATRVTGILLWGVLGLTWLYRHGWAFSRLYKFQAWRNALLALRSDYRNFIYLCFSPLGLMAYMLFLYATFDRPLAFIDVQSSWNRSPVGFWDVIPSAFISVLDDPWRSLTRLGPAVALVNLSAFFVALVASVLIWARLGPAYGLLGLLGILIPASTGLASLARYCIVLFPVFISLALLGTKHYFNKLLMLAFFMLQAILLALYSTWHFIG